MVIQKSPFGDFTELFFNKGRFIIVYFEMLDINILCPMDLLINQLQAKTESGWNQIIRPEGLQL